MLPAAIPEASIFTYDWDVGDSTQSPPETLTSLAKNLLANIAQRRDSASRPIIFIAHSIGGLVLAEAINQASRASNSRYRSVLSNITGVVFLSTPFHIGYGSVLSRLKNLLSYTGKWTSMQFLQSVQMESRRVAQSFAKLVHEDSVRLSVHCFFETNNTGSRRELVVPEQSACLDGVPSTGLDAGHLEMQRFDGSSRADFGLGMGVVKRLADDAPAAIRRRKNLLPSRLDATRTLSGVRLSYSSSSSGFPKMGVLPVPIKSSLRVSRVSHAYGEIARQIGLGGIGDDSIVGAVRDALSDEKAGNWLFIIDNADDLELLVELSDYFPSSQKGHFVFTTRNSGVSVRLNIPREGVIVVDGLIEGKAAELMRAGSQDAQLSDPKNTERLMEPRILENDSMYRHRDTNTELKERMFGRGHPETLASMDELEILHGIQEKQEKAEQMYRQMTALMKQVSEQEQTDTLASITLNPFTDSGYASGSATKPHYQAVTTVEDPVIDDDAQTTYSAATSLADSDVDKQIADIADDLLDAAAGVTRSICPQNWERDV
ncbi:hypothetical protein GGR52DRAFT_387555 [Hypoxylon sp. FL1284]|nr:hypothetical protein GGR52DRAFT_387555 [Hypoxylon sp. FL1284]